MKLYQRIFIFLIFTLSISLITAQDNDFLIQGIVQNHAKQGVNGVAVFVENTKIKTQTDQNGNFKISYKKGVQPWCSVWMAIKKSERK